MCWSLRMVLRRLWCWQTTLRTASTSSDMCVCNAGYYHDSNNVCTQCDTGYIKPEAGNYICYPCAIDTYWVASDQVCSPCAIIAVQRSNGTNIMCLWRWVWRHNGRCWIDMHIVLWKYVQKYSGESSLCGMWWCTGIQGWRKFLECTKISRIRINSSSSSSSSPLECTRGIRIHGHGRP